MESERKKKLESEIERGIDGRIKIDKGYKQKIVKDLILSMNLPYPCSCKDGRSHRPGTKIFNSHMERAELQVYLYMYDGMEEEYIERVKVYLKEAEERQKKWIKEQLENMKEELKERIEKPIEDGVNLGFKTLINGKIVNFVPGIIQENVNWLSICFCCVEDNCDTYFTGSLYSGGTFGSGIDLHFKSLKKFSESEDRYLLYVYMDNKWIKKNNITNPYENLKEDN